ncbi:M56 family metallopeptidase [Flavobacterium chungnamense]|uniref:M56 family metallopeptidase n=1 Tax=Flavobacterium chungnamense TaxID=706182 RepID=UPI0031ED366A
MEEIVTYLLKSSGLLAAFFLAYHFLLRKETFFTSNRWFLLSGLATSILLPLFFITKVVYVESPKITLPVAPENNNLPIIIDKATTITTESIDWLQILFIVYGIVATILIIKVIIDLFSLAKLLRKQTIQKQEDLSYININQDIAPFSFFNYIVFNSSLYSQEELESILLHEKIHSQEKHSVDVLVAKLFTIVFWFNPLIWWYQKAIIQNLEYIADSKAIQNIEDKKCYQMALLKVVSHQNCLPITNHFYQSLIKKRIVMLNKNQSNKKSIWKYTLILPVIIAFVFLFQIKVVAQEKLIQISDGSSISASTREVTEMYWTKNSTDEEFKDDIESLKSSDITMSLSGIKRNDKNEIIEIMISYQDKLGNSDSKKIFKENGIDPIYFRRDINQDGKGEIGFYNLGTNEITSTENEKYVSIFNSQFESDTEDNLDRLFIINGKPYTKEDLKGKNIAIIDGNIIKLSPKEALKKYGKRAKDGAVIFKGETEIINNVLDADFPVPPPPPAPPVKSKTTSEVNQEKNRFYIINGKEYFQNDLKGYTLKCDGAITYYDEEEAVKKFGEKAKDGAMVFNGVTTLEKINVSKETLERKTIIFSNDNGDDIVFIPAEKILKLPHYPSIRLNDEGLILIVNGVQKLNPLETLNQTNLQNVKSVRVFDENGKETLGSLTKKIVITTK